MASTILFAERQCDMYKRDLYGILAMLDDLDDNLLNPDHPVSANDLLWLHFDGDAASLRKVLDHPDLRAAFGQLYPTMGHLLQAGDDLVVELDRLHALRQAILAPHWLPDRSDIHCERVGDHNIIRKEDLAHMYGLTLPQLDAYFGQLDRNGYYLLSMAERQQLYDGIQACFAAVSDELGPLNT